MDQLANPEIRSPVINLSRTFIRRADFSDANLEGANLSFADCKNAIFRRANFRNAILIGTNLQGADLTDARNLTRLQLDQAPTDSATVLPIYLQGETASQSV